MNFNLKRYAIESLSAARQRKNLIMFFVIAHVAFLALGQWMVATKVPGALMLREELLKTLKDVWFLKPLTGALAGHLGLKVLYTFFINLVFGAFLETTVVGVVFFIPYAVAVWRSFIIGVLFYGMELSGLKLVIFYGTFILEFGAYCVSSAVGVDIGLSLLWPRRKGRTSRKDAFFAAITEAKRLYLLVAVLLILGALWEMGWLHYVGPLVTPEKLNDLR